MIFIIKSLSFKFSFALSPRAQSRGLTTHLKSIREMFRLRFNPLFAPRLAGENNAQHDRESDF